VREKIIELLEPKDAAHIWEIGPGLGAMTAHLVETDSRLTLFEIDKMFIKYLRQVFEIRSGVKIIGGDVLKTWKEVFFSDGMPDRIIGNLPYNSAAAIIASFIESGNLPPRMVYTVQKEVGERMVAGPGTKDYSAFSVLCGFACDVRDCGNVAPGCFYPQPHVTSKIVLMTPRGSGDLSLLPLVSSFTRAVFASRRKTIRNNLINSTWTRDIDPQRLWALLGESGIDPEGRGETIAVEDIVGFVKKAAPYKHDV